MAASEQFGPRERHVDWVVCAGCGVPLAKLEGRDIKIRYRKRVYVLHDVRSFEARCEVCNGVWTAWEAQPAPEAGGARPGPGPPEGR